MATRRIGLPLREKEQRWEIDPAHPFSVGINETLSIDQTKHSLFGASKVAADVLVQECGRYFGVKAVCMRGGCLTRPAHAGAEVPDFLAYLIKCTVDDRPPRVFGDKRKHLRDNFHSYEYSHAFWPGADVRERGKWKTKKRRFAGHRLVGSLRTIMSESRVPRGSAPDIFPWFSPVRIRGHVPVRVRPSPCATPHRR